MDHMIYMAPSPTPSRYVNGLADGPLAPAPKGVELMGVCQMFMGTANTQAT